MIKEDRRGISEILATVIIILLVMVAAGIIWVVIRNVIQSGADDVGAGQVRIFLTIDDAYITTESGAQVIKVIVSRDSGEGNLLGVKFVFSENGNSYSVDKMETIDLLGTKTFTFTASDLNISSVSIIEEVSVATIYEVSGDEKLGPITQTSAVRPATIPFYLLNATKTGYTYGSVTSSPAGISCGTTCQSQVYSFAENTQVTLTATPSSGNTFNGWIRCDGAISQTEQCLVTMNGAKFATANFTSGIGSGT